MKKDLSNQDIQASMTSLIACLGAGKGTWIEVTRLIQLYDWEKVFLITNEFGRENFKKEKENIELVLINPFDECTKIEKDIAQQLRGKLHGFEVAVNISSGSGREHMALLSAVMKSGMAFRLVTEKNGKIEEM